jgi:cell division protein FtsX
LSFDLDAVLKNFTRKKEMTLAYIIAAIVILHFVVGIAYLIYKINTAKPSDELKKEIEK